MCLDNNNIIFCTCSEKNIYSKKSDFLKDYSWNLERYLGKNETSLRGRMVIPEKDLGNGITIENVLIQLNSKVKSFDFDYNPSERDCLSIEIPHPTKRIQFLKVLFINGKWTSGGNNIFTSITENIAEGRIKK